MRSDRLAEVGMRRGVHSGGAGKPWVALALLTLVNALLTLDRTIPQIVAELIKREFQLSDSQLGLLLGLTFALPYGAAAIMLGPLIDRVNRKIYVAILVAIWSALTFATGLVGSFLALLIVRACLGAAEATGAPTAYSMVGDLFPAGRRSTAVGIYKIGVPAGIFLAGAIAGLVAETYGWQAAFFFAGVPGFVVAALIFLFMKEPVRGAMDGEDAGVAPQSYGAILAFLLRNRVVTPLAIAVLLAVFSGASLSGFAGPFLQRHHGIDVRHVGAFFAIGSLLSLASPVLIGLIGDRIVRNGTSRLAFFMGLYALLTTAVAITMVSVASPIASIAAFIVWQLLSLGLMAPSYGLLITLTPAGMRGTVMALTGVGTMGLGFGLGPMLVGLVSDSIGGVNALRWALVLVIALSGVAGAILYIIAGRRLAVDECESSQVLSRL